MATLMPLAREQQRRAFGVVSQVAMAAGMTPAVEPTPVSAAAERASRGGAGGVERSRCIRRQVQGAQDELPRALQKDRCKRLVEALKEVPGTSGKHADVCFGANRGKGAELVTAQSLAREDTLNAELWRESLAWSLGGHDTEG